MDGPSEILHFSAMTQRPAPLIPSWQLYGEARPFPDLLHVERIVDRAEGLDWVIAPHRHLHLHQIFLFLSGEIAMTLDGVDWQAEPPFVVNAPRQVVHRFGFSKGTEGFVLTLAANDFPELFGREAASASGLATPFVAQASKGLARSFARTHERHAAQGPLRALRLRQSAIDIACVTLEGGDAVSPPRGGPDARLAGFEALVRRTLAEPLPLADYAKALGLSERHLRRLCQDLFGMSAQGVIADIRLREACRLLAYTRMQVQQVGFALGFDDPAYFSRVFQGRFGLSPGAYRARLEGGSDVEPRRQDDDVADGHAGRA
jgi:AraC family transcriptional regulator, transcriptional activator of pobA